MNRRRKRGGGGKEGEEPGDEAEKEIEDLNYINNFNQYVG